MRIELNMISVFNAHECSEFLFTFLNYKFRYTVEVKKEIEQNEVKKTYNFNDDLVQYEIYSIS